MPTYEESSRRDVLKGMAAGAAGLVLKPVGALGTSPSGALPRSKPSEVGVDPDGIARFVEEVNSKVGGLHSMMLLRHGKVCAEAWWTPYEPLRPHMLYSLSKSFTSTAVGLAAADGLLTVQDRVASFFPEKLPSKVGANLAAMRVHDLLTMNTGHEKEPVRDGADWVKAFLAAPVEHKPGTRFLYNTSATHVLAAIVTKVTKQRLLDFLTPRLMQPLGIQGARWERAPSGIDFGGSGLSVRTEDIAKFGQLYLRKGIWHGKELIPASWVAEATKKQVSNGDPSQPNDWTQGYGYQFWRCRHGHYRGDGAFGQYCIVMPEFDAVLAITSGVGDMGAVMQAAWTHLSPAMGGNSGSRSSDELRALLRAQEVVPPKGSRTSPLSSKFSGKTWIIDWNTEEIDSVRLDFKSDRCSVAVSGNGLRQRYDCGFDRWIPGRYDSEYGRQAIAARGIWVRPDAFEIKFCFVETPYEWTQTFRFEEDGLAIVGRKMNVGFGSTTKPDLRGRLA